MFSLLCSKVDVIGVIALIIGSAISFVFKNVFICIAAAIISSGCFLYSIYTSRKKITTYKKATNHYKAILSTSVDPWISWTFNGDIVGVSPQFKKLFGLEHVQDISINDVLAAIDANDKDEIYARLADTQQEWSDFIVTTTLHNSPDKIDLMFSKFSALGTSSITIWVRNMTSISKNMDVIKAQLSRYKSENDMFNKILDELPIPVWFRDSDLKLCYCNDKYSHLLETGKARIIEKNLPLVSGTLFGQGHSLAENAKKTGLRQSVAQFAVISGERHKLETLEIPSKLGYIGYALDITELDNALKNIDKLIVAQGEVLESMSTGIAIFDQNMKLSFFNSSYKQMTKFDEIWLSAKPNYAEVLDKQRVSRQLPEVADFAAYKQDQLKMFSSLISPTQDLIHLPNGNVLRRYIAPYQMGGLIFLYDDITDSLMLKRENNTITSVQKEVVNNLLEAVCILGSDNKIKSVNPKMLTLWNINKDCIGMHISDFLDEHQDLISYYGKWDFFKSNIISNLTDRIMKTGRLTTKEGAVLFFSYTPLPDGSHMHSYIDITDTCNVSLAKYEKEQAIISSNNIKHSFVSEVSQEIKEPINLIIGFSELLKFQYFGDLNEKQKKYCECILESCNTLLEFVDNLSEINDITGSQTLSIETFDAINAINSVIEVLKKKAADRGIRLKYEYHGDLYKIVSADKRIVKQVVSNLGNSFIANIKPQGIVNMHVDISQNELSITVSAEDSDKDQKSKLKMFQRMNFSQAAKFTVSEQIKVGLPVIKELVEKHNGSLDLVSTGTKKLIVCKIPVNIEAKEDIAIAV